MPETPNENKQNIGCITVTIVYVSLSIPGWPSPTDSDVKRNVSLSEPSPCTTQESNEPFVLMCDISTDTTPTYVTIIIKIT